MITEKNKKQIFNIKLDLSHILPKKIPPKSIGSLRQELGKIYNRKPLVATVIKFVQKEWSAKTSIGLEVTKEACEAFQHWYY